MGDIFDYIKWRGDLSFKQSPFNEVDSLILSRVCYLPFEFINISDTTKRISIIEAAKECSDGQDNQPGFLMEEDTLLLEALSTCSRFKDIQLFDFVSHVDLDEQKQFCAMTMLIDESTYFIGFRGTDNTLVGWKEDLKMSFLFPVPAQNEALKYFENAAAKLPGTFLLGGHSKGGNLAVFSATYATSANQRRIKHVYNHDGPGFPQRGQQYTKIPTFHGQISTYIPQSSIIGMLLEQEEPYTIIRSKQLGIMQHDVYSWEVIGTEFVRLDDVTKASKYIDKTMTDWIFSVGEQQREEFIDTLFSVLENTNAYTFNEMKMNWYKNALIMLKSLSSLDSSTKQMVSHTLLMLVKSAKKNMDFIYNQEKTIDISKTPARG